MAKIQIYNASDFDTISGVVDDYTTYETTSPSQKLESGNYAVKDVVDLSNFAITMYFKPSNVTDSKFRLLIGCDGSGAGKAVDIVYASTSHEVIYGDVTTFTSAMSVIETKDYYNNQSLNSNAVYFKLSVIISDNYLKVLINDRVIVSDKTFAPTGTNIAISGVDTASAFNVSDTIYYREQVMWGNINLGGIAYEGSLIRLYKQDTHEFIKSSPCDSDGDYVLLIEDDPANGNRYYMIATINDSRAYQPRGVSNITV